MEIRKVVEEHPSFAEQFKLQKLEIGEGNSVEVIDVVPEHEEGNPVLFNLGWIEQLKDSEAFIEGFYKGNKRVISFQYPTHEPSHDSLPEGFSQYGYRNALAGVRILVEKGINEVDLVGYSEGAGISLMENSLLQEQGIKVNNIVLINPVGFRTLGLKESVGRLIKLAGQERSRAKQKPELASIYKKIQKTAFKSFLRRPLNTFGEGMDVSRVELDNLLSFALEKGQQVGILQAGDDPLVPVNELEAGIEAALNKGKTKQIKLTTNHHHKIISGETNLHIDEEGNPRFLVVTVPESDGAGHRFHGFYPKNPNFYTPLAVDMLNYLRTGEFPKIS